MLLLINGHRLNENVYNSALIGTEFPLDLDLIDHIEVVRGPGSSLFGTNAVFAVINVITRSPGGNSAIEVSGDTASFLGRKGRISATVSKGKLEGLFSGSLYRSAGVPQLFFPEFDAPDTNFGLAEDVDGDHYSQAFGRVQYGGFRAQGMYSSRTKTVPSALYGSIFNDPATQETDAFAQGGVEYHHTFASQTELDLRSSFNRYHFAGQYAFYDPQAGDRTLYSGISWADWLGLEAVLGRQFGKHRLTLGASYEYSVDVRQTGRQAGHPFLLNDSRTPWQAGVFGEAELQLLRKLTLHVGGRLDYFDAYGSALSPRVALVYSPSARSTLKYIFGTSFRAPSSFESYYGDGVTTELPPVPLKKENIESHEVVFQHSLTPWLVVTADGYFNVLDNLIDHVNDPATGMNESVNVGEAADRARGLEVEIEAKRASGLGARASYELADARDNLQAVRLANSPFHQAKLHASLPATRRAFFGIEFLYASAQRSYQGTLVPASSLSNVTFSTRPLWGGWEFAASCYNVFNRSSFAPMGPFEIPAAIRQDGRSYRFNVSYRLPLRHEGSRP